MPVVDEISVRDHTDGWFPNPVTLHQPTDTCDCCEVRPGAEHMFGAVSDSDGNSLPLCVECAAAEGIKPLHEFVIFKDGKWHQRVRSEFGPGQEADVLNEHRQSHAIHYTDKQVPAHLLEGEWKVVHQGFANF